MKHILIMLQNYCNLRITLWEVFKGFLRLTKTERSYCAGYNKIIMSIYMWWDDI